MESIAEPLRRLQEEASWFARATEIRLLWVPTEAALRSTALTLSERFEYHADNHSLFIPLDTPWSGPDLGAAARDAHFTERFTQKAQALRDAGVEVGPFSASAEGASSLESWARHLHAACASLKPPLRGLVVVLAPTRIDDAAAFLADVRALVSSKALQAVRWIIIETDTLHLAPLVQELGEQRALTADFRIDPAQQQRDLAALASPPTPPANAPGPTNATPALPFPWGPWTSAGAMPQTPPPRRLDDPEPPTDEQLRASGLSPAYLKGGAQQMQRLMLGAALALRQHRSSDAIELQARTADLCGRMQMPKEQVIQLLVLGGYQLADAKPGAARETYQRATHLAGSEGLALQQAQAELGLGMLDAMAQKPDALTHYAAAGRLSEQAGIVPLAIECWRMAGQCAGEHGATERALEHWEHALSLSETLSPEVRRTTSAADIARLLANAQQARGHHAQANLLHRHAFEIEHGTPPHPAPPSTRPLPPPGE